MYDDQILMYIGMFVYLGIPAIIIAAVFYFIGKRKSK